MKLNKKFILAILFLFCFSLFGCGQDNNQGTEEAKNNDDKLQVYASFYGVYDFASKIGGDKVDVYNVIPNGTEPHNWEPTSGDMLKISKGDILFYNGGGMESWVDKVKASVENDKIKFVALSDGIELINSDEEHSDNDDHEHGNLDPHVWLDPENAKKEAEIIKDTLSSADPENAEYYSQNYDTFAKNADKLNEDFRAMVDSSKSKTIVVAHEAYGYLCKAYGLEQLAIDGLSADSEPSPAKMTEISNFVKENNVKYIFFEELLTQKTADVISEETGAELLVLNPFEGLTQEESDNGDDYFSIMYRNLENIKKALN